MEPSQVPDFDNLPKVEGMPQGCAWGVFDKDGKKDLLGTLNFLTPAVRRAAYAEAKDGVAISLNWPLNAMSLPVPGRMTCVHTPKSLQEAGISSGAGWDDELHFNTQTSSQWDSLVHWQDQKSGLAYNGIKVTKEALSVSHTAANEMPTLDHWHRIGGMVARGVLIDFKAWKESQLRAEGKDATIRPFEGYRITVDEVEAIAQAQGVEFRPGDVLIIRTGWTDMIGAVTPEDLAKLTKVTVSGLHGVAESAKWLWNKRFAAAAGDNPAFEALMPLREDGSTGTPEDLYLHPWMLSMFGMPIGELWDLQALSEHCSKTKRYSFLLTSTPLNMPGLVGSPPNAMAVF